VLFASYLGASSLFKRSVSVCGAVGVFYRPIGQVRTGCPTEVFTNYVTSNCPYQCTYCVDKGDN